jgi:outer membrane protein assembly factor BamB
MRRAWFALLLLVSVPAVADWPHLRGPAYDGRASFDDEAANLELAWKVPLGSGYSGVSAADGKVVTMFSDADADWLAAFDAANGQELWRHRMGDVTPGIDGADDGPLSTPTIGDGHVFALGADGNLVAARLADGEPAWTKNIVEAFGAVRPHFGFATTPLVDDGLLFVQAGGPDGRVIVAMNAKNGKVKWSHGEGKVIYQSPTLMTLAGERTLVVATESNITGLTPDKGKVLWEKPLGEDTKAPNSNPTFLGDDRFMIVVNGGVEGFRVLRRANGLEAEQIFASDVLGNNYTPGVYRDGHVYGFRGQVLACMNAESGDRVWRSRPPGGDGLILVDDRLVIYGAKGNVVIADATPEGYQERAALQTFETSAFTWPSFADGKVFVRTLDELAALEIGTGAPDPGEVVEGLLQAFNDHDVDAMATFVADDVQWLAVQGAEIAVEADGKEALVAGMKGYFASIPKARSEAEGTFVSGRYVTVRERAYWTVDGEDRSQSSLAVYEVEDGKVLRVWYYPAE